MPTLDVVFSAQCVILGVMTEPWMKADLTVANEIRAALARQRVSQTELARRLGVSRPWVARRLSGETQLTVGDVALIARKLDIPVAQLVIPVDENLD